MINMQISFPVHTVNHYLVVYINAFAYYKYIVKADSTYYIIFFFFW